MTRLGKTWCDTCKKDTHDTKDCWGQGTMAVGPETARDPVAGLSIGSIFPPVSFSHAVLTQALHDAIRSTPPQDPRCTRCGLLQSECDFQRNFPDPEPFA